MTHLDWKASAGSIGAVISVRTAATERACCRACFRHRKQMHDRREGQRALCCTLFKRQNCCFGSKVRQWCLTSAAGMFCRDSNSAY